MIISMVNEWHINCYYFLSSSHFSKKIFHLGNYFFPVNSLHLVCKAIVGRKNEILVKLFQIVNLF